MSAEKQNPLDEVQQFARKCVRELSRPAARDEFREEIRASFVRPQARRSVARGLMPRPWQVLAAAAVLILFVMNRPAEWRVLGSEGVEQVLVDGRLVDIAELERELRPGRVLQLTGPGRLDIVSAGNLFFQLEDEIRFELPSSPARWIGRSVDASVGGSGRLRVMTGERFPGATLTMHGGLADWEVTGTCFTVIAHEGLLCLCVLEGEVRACPTGGEMQPIPSGERATFLASSHEVDRGEMREDERAALSALSSRAVALLAP